MLHNPNENPAFLNTSKISGKPSFLLISNLLSRLKRSSWISCHGLIKMKEIGCQICFVKIAYYFAATKQHSLT